MPRSHPLDAFVDRLLAKTGLCIRATEVANNPWASDDDPDGTRHFLVRLFMEPFITGKSPEGVVTFCFSTLSGMAPSMSDVLEHLGILAHTFEKVETLEGWAQGVGLDPGEEATETSYAWGKVVVEGLQKLLGDRYYRELLEVVAQ